MLWAYDALPDFTGVNGLPGAAARSPVVVVADGMVYVQAGCAPEYPSPDGGDVLLAFGL